MNVKKKTLIVVADRTRARLFSYRRGSQLELAGELSSPDGRKRDQEIDTDRPGQVVSATGSAPHALVRHEPSHEHAASDFARKIARRIESARNQNQFEDLVLVAEPRFLGMLRSALDSVTAKHVRRAAGHDLAHISVRDLRRRMEELLRP